MDGASIVGIILLALLPVVAWLATHPPRKPDKTNVDEIEKKFYEDPF